ncbi:MAG TPA: WD40 repeat domain-containing protein [Pirellulales bacterium]|nr:WD40 repeat domain-containing protein [Pirellulales bacterium]
MANYSAAASAQAGAVPRVGREWQRARGLNRRRWLLIVLVPLLALGTWLVRCERKPIFQIAFSPDGKLLATASGRAGRNAAQAWDWAGQEVVFSIDSPHAVGSVVFSPDGSLLATADFDGTVEIWDVAEHRKKCTFQTKRTIQDLGFSTDGKTLICVDWKGSVKACEIATGRIRSLGPTAPRGASVVAILSAGAKRIAVSANPPGTPGKTTIYEVGDVGCKPVAVLPNPSTALAYTPLAFSPDGMVFARSDWNTGVQLYDLRSRTILATLPHRFATGACFSADGGLLFTHGQSGPVRMWDIATSTPRDESFVSVGTTITDVDLAPVPNLIAAATGYGNQFRIWDIASQAEIAALPRYVPLEAIFIGGLIAFTAWAAAWAASGLPSRNVYVALADVTLINGLITVALISRIVNAGEPGNTTRPAVSVSVGVLAGLLCLAIIWAVLGGSRWQWRLPALVTTWAVVWAVPVAVCYARDYGPGGAWELMVGVGAMFVALLGILWHCKSRGLRLTCEGVVANVSPAVPRQFLLKDLVLWTTAAALLFAVARHAAPRFQPLVSTSFELLAGVSLAVAAAAGLWAAFSRRRPALRAFALVVASVVSGLTTEVFRITLFLQPWWWYVSVDVAAAFCVAASLTVFRIHGVRLANLNRDGAPSVSATSP